MALRFNSDPRTLDIRMDADSGTVVTSPELGDVSLGYNAAWPLSSYGSLAMARSFSRDWKQRSVSNINSLGTNTPQTTAHQSGIYIPLPVALPGKLSGILGPGGPSINVRGSENIRISGTSNWTNQQVGQLGQKKSLFPSLDMQQDLDIQLEGQLSDRIRINLLQNSANQIPLSNRIAINYRGDEDALFQQIDLGNTNLTLPGTQYVSYSGKNEGLFGMKATSRFGPLDFTLLASKQEGRSERASYGGGSSKQQSTIRDLEYVRSVYFFLADPNEGPFQIDEGKLDVYHYGKGREEPLSIALIDDAKTGSDPSTKVFLFTAPKTRSFPSPRSPTRRPPSRRPASRSRTPPPSVPGPEPSAKRTSSIASFDFLSC
jgi:cell surface protein SprA